MRICGDANPLNHCPLLTFLVKYAILKITTDYLGLWAIKEFLLAPGWLGSGWASPQRNSFNLF